MTTTPVIDSVATTLLTAPMPRPWVPAAPELHVIRVRVTCSDGVIGEGFSWTPTIGRHAVRALIDTDIARFVSGRPADPAELSPTLWAHLHEAGGGGITTIAASGVDIALWDAAGKRSGLGLADAIGRRRGEVGVYGSGVNLHYSIDELVAQTERFVARGYRAAKIKVGKADVAEDVDRVAAVREVLGPQRRLMLDANQRWALCDARAALDALTPFDPAWIEEPLRSDDTAGYRALRRETDLPIALGENLHTLHRFRDLADAEGIDILQPNVVRVGGITTFLSIAAFAAERGLRFAPHLLIELSGQLAMTTALETDVEDVEAADLDTLGLLASPSPVQIRGDRLTAPGTPGTGITLVDAIAPTARSN